MLSLLMLLPETDDKNNNIAEMKAKSLSLGSRYLILGTSIFVESVVYFGFRDIDNGSDLTDQTTSFK